MKSKKLGIVLVSLLVIQLVFFGRFSFSSAAEVAQPSEVFVGIDVAYANLTANKALIDKVSSYTNLFVIGSSAIAYNNESLNEIAQYLFDRNMSFIVYSDDARKISSQWFETAKNRWTNHFLGLYIWDEPGGKIVDRAYDWWGVYNADNYEDAGSSYVSMVSRYLSSFSRNAGTTPFFTSDYALYWYDYKAGYSTVFAEYGWNYSRQINTALCRGAATAQNKDWGIMITWTYTHPPYIESGPELYSDMVLAYESGAKYIVVFDSNEDWTAGILKEEHYSALEQFWQYVQSHPRKTSTASGRVAYVLPDYYAYGFRGPDDKIWGIWESNSDVNSETPTYDLSMAVGYVLMLYMDKIDLVYENGQSANSYGYSGLIYWNDPRLFQPQDQFPNISPLPSPPSTLTPTPSATPSVTQSPTPSPSEAPSSTPVQTSPPTSSNDPPSNSLPLQQYFIALTASAVTAISVGSVYWLRKRNK